jgi:hypothetical protein
VSSIVIAIQRDTTSDGLAARLYRAPNNYPGGMDPSLLNLPVPMPACDTGANVTAYGQAIFAALSTHQAIAFEIQRLAMMPAATADALQFRIETPLAERVRWETLCRPANQFLAVAPGCRITRLVSNIADGGVGVRTYTLPLKLMAFVSALGISARAELEELVGQVRTARARGLPVEAQIYLGEQALLNEKMAASEPGFSFLPMPSSADAMKAEIKCQEFQFLHLFGHGATRLGLSTLEFGTITDNLRGVATGSVKLVIDELVTALEVQKSTWLTVLNSCSGAEAFPQLNSMAFKIAERGSPVAVGMNEPIDAADATRFTRTFYREVLVIVQAALEGSGDGMASLDLTPAIVPVRQRFYEMYVEEPPEAFGRWSLPVLYENPASLQVRPLMDMQMKARVDTVAEALRNLPPTTPDTVRDQVLAILDRAPAVPAALRPDRQGKFD